MFTLDLFEVERRYGSEGASDSEREHTILADEAADAFIQGIAMGGEEVVDEGSGGNWVEDNALGTGAERTADISALVERLTSLEGTVRANSTHDQSVLDNKLVKLELIREQNLLLGRVGLQLEFLKDAVVAAEKERRKDHLFLLKERQREARHKRLRRKADSKGIGMLRETVLALSKQLELSGDKVANTIAQHTNVVRLAQASAQMDTIQESSDTASSSQRTSPATSPVPTGRRGLRLQWGRKKGSYG